jgi:hypothetical protein
MGSGHVMQASGASDSCCLDLFSKPAHHFIATIHGRNTMKPTRDPEKDDTASEEESDLSPDDQAKQDKKDYDQHIKKQVGNYL